MGFFKSTKGSIISDYFVILHDLGHIKRGGTVDIALYDDHLTITPAFSKDKPINLSYSRITDVYYGIETEIKEKRKSPIGRAAVGGLLFGGYGAVVGAVSGQGSKQQKEYKHMFIISYTSKTGEDAFLQFDDTRKYKGAKLAKYLKNLCGIEDDVITDL